MKERKSGKLYYSYIIEDVIRFIGQKINNTNDNRKQYLSDIIWLCSGFLPIISFFEEKKSFKYGEYLDLVNSYFENNDDIKKDLLDDNRYDITKTLYKRKRKKLYLKAFTTFNNALAEITDEHLEDIRDMFASNVYNYPQTFLSYTYMDRGITLLIFFYFLLNEGYLYIDWMHSPAYPNGVVIKDSVNEALEASNQLLFLYTPNSEFTSKGKRSLKAWCSWEFGSFYHRSHQSKFYLRIPNGYSSYDIPDILDTFMELQFVDRGVMQGRERKLMYFYVPKGRDAEEISLNLLIEYVSESYSQFTLVDPFTSKGPYYRYDAYNPKTRTAIEFGMIRDASKEKAKEQYEIYSREDNDLYYSPDIYARLNNYIVKKMQQLRTLEVNAELVILLPTRMSSSLEDKHIDHLEETLYEYKRHNIKKLYLIFIDCIYEFVLTDKIKLKEHSYSEKDE